jgi:hypothetical protein
MAQAARLQSALNKPLQTISLDAQTTPEQQTVIREVPHVRTRTLQTFISYGGSKTHPEYQPFAEALRQAMIKGKLSASEVARRVWGETTDKRGYKVAKNRDRLGHYLAGTSYPEPSNLVLLAKAVDVPVETLKVERPEPNPGSRARVAGGDLRLSPVAERPDKSRLQVDQIVDWRLAAKIYEMLKEAELHDLEAEIANQRAAELNGEPPAVA